MMVRGEIFSLRKMRLRIAENIGIDAKMKTTLATLVFSTAMTNAGDVDPIRKQYTHPSFPIKKRLRKLYIPLNKIRKKTIITPAVRLLQNAVINGSDAINRTNNESGTTSSTPNMVISNPFWWSAILIPLRLSPTLALTSLENGRVRLQWLALFNKGSNVLCYSTIWPVSVCKTNNDF